MSKDIFMMTATELVALYKSKNLSPVEATQAVLDRIDAVNETYNAFCVVDADRALADARESEARWQRGEPRGLIDGVPATIKDLMLSKGWPTLRGSKTVDADQAWDEDAPIVARMREHGAVFLGKTTTPEFGWKGVTDSPVSGSTGNPWNPALCSGGSSGGAAVAAALGMGTLNIGSDGGGSIRMPGAFCGIFGIKSTFGIVPAYPQSAMSTLSHHGPMTRTVSDAALMLSVISEPDPRDWFAGPPLGIDYRDGLEGGVRGLRIAYSRDLGWAWCDPDVAALVDQAVSVFADLGAEVEEIETVFDDPTETMVTHWSVGLAVLVDGMNEAQRAVMDPPLLELAEQGRAVDVVALRHIEMAREALGRRMSLFHTEYDLLMTPQLPLTAFPTGNEVPPGRGMTRWWEWSPFTYPFNLTQQPAATVPCGLTPDGLPAALQIVGAKYADPLVLRAARAYEAAHPFQMPTA